jgi:glycosyltransferase involved in cell wall biosynthesis
MRRTAHEFALRTSSLRRWGARSLRPLRCGRDVSQPYTWDMTISAVINTRNAAATLTEALGSIRPWVDEIVVVDMHSTDETRDIAKRHGARVLLHEPMGIVEPARAWSVEQARGDWVILLDADEVIPRRLSDRLREIAARDEADVVDIPELNYFFGRPIMYGGWHPDHQRHLRFFRKGTVHCASRVHAAHSVAPGARLLVLRYEPGLAIRHFAYATVREFLERTDRYTSLDTDTPPRSMRRQIMRGLHEVGNRAVSLRGIRDGSRGVALAVLMGVYEWMLWLKRVDRHAPITRSRWANVANRGLACTIAAVSLLERLRWPRPEQIRADYLAEAQRLVAEYGAT